MTASTLSCSVVAIVLSVAACGGGAAFAPPAPVARRPGRFRFGVAASEGGRDGGEGTSEEISTRTRPVSPAGGASALPYVRIQRRGRHYDVQTAVTTFQKLGDFNEENLTKTTTVDLHAQIHFGDASYFEHFNDNTFDSRYDKVLYELIVEDKFLKQSSAGTPSLKQLIPMPGCELNPIAPTQADRNTASQYGLQCQVDAIRYCREGWIHADLTREEFLGWLERGGGQKEKQTQQLSNDERGERPLWALASTAATYPGSELVTSLLRPLTATSASAALTRRLFTHLFLPGDALAGWIRAALWLGVPSPELSVLLVDWSSLSYLTQRGRRRGSGEDWSGVGPISPIAAPVFLSLLTGNWGTARRLVFGQVLAGGQNSDDSSKGGILIDRRNERAVDVLRDSLASLDDGQARKRVALLYGAGHCRDLHQRLVREEGMAPVRTEWRTAFRASAPRWGDFVDVDDWRATTGDIASRLPPAIADEGVVQSVSVSTLESAAVGLVILPLYLLIGGIDWVSTVGDLGNALDRGAFLDGFADLFLYLVRHVALYVGISKFVVDWGGSGGVFEDADSRA